MDGKKILLTSEERAKRKRKAQQKYEQSAKGKAKREAYAQSEEGREKREAYKQSDARCSARQVRGGQGEKRSVRGKEDEGGKRSTG